MSIRGSKFHANLSLWWVSFACKSTLILTDGFWTRDDVKTLSRWQEGLPPDTLRVIQIGADANPHLSKGLKGAKVFAAEEVLAVLDNWLQADEEWA